MTSASIRVRNKLQKVLLQSLCDLTKNNSTKNYFSLEELVQKAQTAVDYVDFQWDNIPYLLESYVADGLISYQEKEQNNSGKHICYGLENAAQLSSVETLAELLSQNLQRENIPNKNITNNKSTELVEDIRQLKMLGLSAEDMTKEMGISYNTLLHYAYKNNIHFKEKREINIAEVKQLLQEDNLREIYRRFSFKSPLTFVHFCRQNKITIPEQLTPYNVEPEIYSLVQQGAPIKTIAAQYGYTSNWACDYLLGSGLHSQGKQLRTEKRTEKTKKFQKDKLNSARQDLLRVLYAKLNILATEQGWAYEKAVEYWAGLNKNHPNVKPFADHVQLFEIYAQAQAQGIRLSLQKISRKVNFNFTTIGNILKIVGLKPMYNTPEKNPAPVLKVIKRGIDLGLGSSDLMYFLDLPSNKVAGNFTNGKISSSSNLVVHLFNRKSRRDMYIPFYITSEIYEASDAGFTEPEICELIKGQGKAPHGYDLNIINDILLSRHVIEPEIVDVLQKLYGKADLDKPYKIHIFNQKEEAQPQEKENLEQKLEREIIPTIIDEPEQLPLNSPQNQVEKYVRQYQERVETKLSDLKLRKFFEIYINAIANDKPITIRDLSFKSGISIPTANKIIDTLLLPYPRQPMRRYYGRWF